MTSSSKNEALARSNCHASQQTARKRVVNHDSESAYVDFGLQQDYIWQMTTFEEFTRARYAALQQERAQLHMQLRAVQRELEEIEKAARASSLQLTESETRQQQAVDKAPISNMTMKEASVEILKKYPDGLSAKLILSELNEMLGSNYVRSSLSPQLSRLKKDGIIYDVNGIWTLTKEAPEHL